MFPYIDLGIVNIPVYSSLFIVAFFLAVLAARKAGKRFGIAKEDVLYGSVYAAIGILIGSKLLYFITKVEWLGFRRGRLSEKCSADLTFCPQFFLWRHGLLWGTDWCRDWCLALLPTFLCPF